MKKLKAFLESVKSWAELFKWYIGSIGAVVAAAAVVARFWHAILRLWREAAIQVPIDARLLVGTPILIVLIAAIVLWFVRHRRHATTSLDALKGTTLEPARRPEIQDRLLSILWKHKGIQVPFFARFMAEAAPTLEYHLERLAHERFVFRTGPAWTVNPAGKDYVVKHGLENLVDTSHGRLGANGVSSSQQRVGIEITPGVVSMTDAVRRKVRMLIDRMEAEKKKCAEGSSARATMDHTQADLETIDADLNQSVSPSGSVAKYGLTWNSRNEPVCSQCRNPLSFHDVRSLRCFTCNRDFAPNQDGRPMTVAEALRLQNGAIT